MTPLATTHTALQVVEGGISEEEFRELLPMLVEANNRSIAIVRSLLRLADAENARLDLRSVDLGDLVATTANDYAAQARERDVRLHVHTDAACRVETDPVLLRQLVANLIENGLGHNLARGSMRTTVRRHNATVVMETANTGPYADDETADRLFDLLSGTIPRRCGRHRRWWWLRTGPVHRPSDHPRPRRERGRHREPRRRDHRTSGTPGPARRITGRPTACEITRVRLSVHPLSRSP
ncbi:sensor histidine kinase [Embleya sp. NPDC001921]